MCYLSAEKVAHCRQPDMRVWQHIERRWFGELFGNGPGVVHEDKRAYHAPKPEGEDAFDLHGFANGRVACFDHHFYHDNKLGFFRET